MKIKERLCNKEAWIRYRKSMRYALHCCVRPFDGFWDLTHEKRGSIAAANTIVILVLLTNLIKLGFTSFIFSPVNWDEVNMILEVATFLVPFIVYCVANWCLTTLFDGEGSLKDIFIATTYSLLPVPMLVLPSVIFSNILAENEGQLITLLVGIAFAWAGLLIFFGMMVTHDYSLGKNILTSVGTIVGMAFIIFVAVLFSSLVARMVSFVSSIVVELTYRI